MIRLLQSILKRMQFMYLLIFALWLAGANCLSLDRQPNDAYRARRVALAQKMGGGVAIVFAGTEAEGPNAVYGFRQDNDFYYLSGSTEPGAALVIVSAIAAKENVTPRPYTEILFLPIHNVTQEKWTGPKLGADNPQAPTITGFDHVDNLDQMPATLARILGGGSATIYIDQSPGGEIRPADSAMDWLRRANTFPLRTTTLDIKPLLAQLRVAKDQGEIDRVQHATNASIAAHMAAFQMLKPGLNEHDIATRMQYEFMKHGCERPAYAPIVGAGANSTVLHYSADDAPIKSGDVVVMDVAGEYAMYASDITRTAPASGKFTDRQREIYNIVLGAQQAAMNAFKQGKTRLSGRGSDSLAQVAFDYINSHGKDLHGQPLGQYFIHGLGHYVGLEVHDVGDVMAPIPRGAVFTVEPGIYIPEEKLGVRIEDIVWISPEGKLVDLTAALPHSAEEVEAAMAGKFTAKQ